MIPYGVATTIRYRAFNTITGLFVVESPTLHTLNLVRDGVESAAAGAKTAKSNGDYALAVSGAEASASILWANGSSATAGVVLLSDVYATYKLGVDGGFAGQSQVDAGFAAITFADVYEFACDLTRDGANTRDEYSLSWRKNGIPVTAGITVPTLEVVTRAGAVLIAEQAMTAVGNGVFTFNEATNRITLGEAVRVRGRATIDGDTRDFYDWFGRDKL